MSLQSDVLPDSRLLRAYPSDNSLSRKAPACDRPSTPYASSAQHRVARGTRTPACLGSSYNRRSTSRSSLPSMYLSYFGLAEAPFSIAPDPRYLYLTRSHQEALAHLLYGVSGDGGFVLLTGEVGAGKTTVSRCLLEQMPESCDVAYIFNPRLTVEELLSTLCVELGIAVPADNHSVKLFVDRINAYLLDANAKGRRTVLVIDEAQNLSADVLEQMRLLTNLETNQRKLLQIILLGQPELAEMLARPELRQLAQRIVARYHLGPLPRTEL